jgi:hypothetical protein
MIDLLLIVVIAAVTWCVASEGPWGAASTFVSVILAGLLAMNFFEPLASMFPASLEWQNRADVIALLGLFAAFVTGLRYALDYLMPTRIEVQPMAYDGARWGLGAATGYVTAAILLTALHTAPLPREFLGFRAERANLFDTVAPDRQWLAFTQHASEHIFTTGNVFDGPRFEKYPGSGVSSWSSFPIRYAERREKYASGGAVSTASNAPPSGGAPPPTPGPTPGRSSGPAF